MAELTIEQLIKIIIGVLVFAVVVAGVYMFFKNSVLEFFRSGNEPAGVMLSLIR